MFLISYNYLLLVIWHNCAVNNALEFLKTTVIGGMHC